MRSFKRMVTIIVFAVLVTLSSLILVNIFYVNPIIEDINHINDQLKKSNEQYIGMDLPIRVLNNVRTQLFDGEPIEEEREQRILSAYNENYEKLLAKSMSLTRGIKELTQDSQTLNEQQLLHFVLSFDEVLDDLRILNEEVRLLVEDIQNLSNVEASRDIATMDQLFTSYNGIRTRLDKVTDSYTSIKREGVGNYLLLINVGFIILLVIVVILAALLTKILGQDLKFVMQGFKMLNQYDYDQDHLPKIRTHFFEEKQMKELVTEIFEEQEFLNQIKEIVSSGYILDEILDSLFYSIQGGFKADRLGVAFVDYNSHRIIAEHGVFNYGKVLLGPGFEVRFKDTTLTELIENKQSMIMKNIEEELKKRPHSPSLRLLKKEGIKSNMVIPLIVNNMVFGFLFFSSIKENHFDEKSLQLGKNIAYEVSAILDKAHLTKRMFSTITRTFADLVEKKDNETGDHINRMTSYSKVLAEALLLHEDSPYQVTMGFVNDIENNAAIHDIGKVGIPDRILKKPGKLTAEEWEIMKQHAAMGGDILMGLKESLQIFNKGFYQIAIEIARHHHERWDGTGYPDGLKGQEIPLAARIVAIGDVFDAISSKRVYKAAYGFEESIEIINKGSGTHFDPELIRVFNTILPRIRKVYDADREQKTESYPYEKQLG